MASIINVQIVYNHFGKVAQELEQKAADVVAKSAIKIQAQARINTTRVDTGAMKGGYLIEDDGPGGLAKIVYNTQEYHYFHELGTTRITPLPMLLPAAEGERAAFEQEMKKVLG